MIGQGFLVSYTKPVNFTRFFAAHIDFPKPLVALLNGASVGGGATVLALCDAVYAKESVCGI